MGVISVVLADDHRIWLTGVAEELGDGFHVLGTASSATEAIDVVACTSPDVVLTDLRMPGGGGIAVARACGDKTKVVVLTVSEEEQDLLEAVAAGAVGYLLKSTPPEELRSALAKAAAGEPVFSPALASLVLQEFRKISGQQRDAGALSEREREVLQLVARGHTYREIGGELFISEKTVENHVRNILRKLHLSRRPDLIRYALEHGLE